MLFPTRHLTLQLVGEVLQEHQFVFLLRGFGRFDGRDCHDAFAVGRQIQSVPLGLASQTRGVSGTKVSPFTV